MTWIPLNVHSQFSILDSTASLKALAKRAKELNIPALAITDQGNLYGAVDFYKACKSQGVKPIFGCKIWMAPNSRHEKKRIPGTPNGFPILLFAKDDVGYHNLCKLSSIGFTEGFYYQPRIDKEALEKHREGLICLAGQSTGPIGYLIQEEREKELKEEIAWYKELFRHDFYFDLQRYPFDPSQEKGEGWLLQKRKTFSDVQQNTSEKLISLSKEHSISIVATSEIHYINKDDFEAHEILLNVQSGESVEIWERDSMGNQKNKIPNPKRDVAKSSGFYFKTPEEMKELFSDVPEAIDETLKIAEKCNVQIDFQTKHYPVFSPPTLKDPQNRKEEAENYLLDLCKNAIPTRYSEKELTLVQKKNPGKNPLEVVEKRLSHEFEILASKGMCDYMLIVYDFIHWAKKKNIPVGPGRGSAAGSIISYLIGITDIEPLRFDLFFERFINPERLSYPDIDVDICMNRRGEVIDYVIDKYGKDKVAQIITFGTMKAKMAIRDVGRVLGVSLAKVNQIAALIPEDPGMTLEKAFELDPELSNLMETDEEAKRILTMARKAEGSIRNTSTHAAGLIISESSITEHIPICTAKDTDMLVTQFAMKPVESVGMLKIDFLGLKTLTSLQTCTDEIYKREGKKVDWSALPLDDKKTFSLMNQGKTLGIFQLESGGMADLIQQLQIDRFEEIIAVVALYRPGPMDMIPSYINRKHGREEIEMDHPLMKDILEETYGVMVYQEQVMQIASTLAGYSLGEGDVLRRAMGKKDREEMARQREKFSSGCISNGIDEEKAKTIFDKIEKFASYGFNKSHAAAYAYLSYATSYFKAHHPKEWMAALMTCDKDDTTKVAKFISEAKALKIEVLPPDINEASDTFSSADKGIRFAMSGIKGVGTHVVEAILKERKNGPFKSLYDFIQRLCMKKVGKKQIELLVEAGCFDFTEWTRDELLLSIEPMLETATKEMKEEEIGMMNLFSLIDEGKEEFNEPPKVPSPSSREHLLKREKELLGFYLTGHPMDAYKNSLQKLSCVPLSDFEKLANKTWVRAAFIIDQLQVKISNKSQKKFAILTISDGLEKFELPVWPELFLEKADLLQESKLIYAILLIEKKGSQVQLTSRFLEDLSSIDEEKMQECDTLLDKLKMQTREPKWKKEKEPKVEKEETKKYILKLDADLLKLSDILKLKDLLRSHPGKSPVEVQFLSHNKKIGVLEISETWGVKKDQAFEEKLTTLQRALESPLNNS